MDVMENAQQRHSTHLNESPTPLFSALSQMSEGVVLDDGEREATSMINVVLTTNTPYTDQVREEEQITVVESGPIGEPRTAPFEAMSTSEYTDNVVTQDNNHQSVNSHNIPERKRGMRSDDFSDRPLVHEGVECEDQIEGEDDSLPTIIGGSDSLREKIHSLCMEFRDIFRKDVSPEGADILPMKLEVDKEKWLVNKNRAPARRMPEMRVLELRKFVQKLKANGVIQDSQAEAWSHALLVPKDEGKWRLCIDFRGLNDCSKGMGWPIPNIKDIFYRLGRTKSKLFGVLDLTSGYYQVLLDEAAREFTAFMTPDGLYEWTRVAMGLKGAPSYFQQKVASDVLSGLLYQICELYIDDVIVHGKTEEEYLQRLRRLFQRCRDRRLFLNPKKCRLGLDQVEYLGHVINAAGVTFSREKIATVLEIGVPVIQKQLKSFLGVANYFRDHIRHFAEIAAPLYNLTKVYSP